MDIKVKPKTKTQSYSKRFTISKDKKHVFDYLDDISNSEGMNMSHFLTELVERYMEEEKGLGKTDNNSIMKKLNSIEKQISELKGNTSPVIDDNTTDESIPQRTGEDLTEDDINDLMAF